ncbi:outer membrane lipoprotein chaperone LolA [Algicola sagamiensis]|uniref:outer membrane lipoprotein chaperone LolA n=1 Tax=Algicola sagamiensis TaxID=163869 RepID=UPI00036C3CE5|nr:outer membrane lipoprotein chaperone LolA [Algicola sagamiensis]
MKLKLIQILSLLCALGAMSAHAVEEAKTAEGAKAELKARLLQVKTFAADFQQKVFDKQNKLVQQSQGVLQLKQPGQLRWEVTSPEPSLIVSNGQTLWYYDEFLEQVSIYDQMNMVQDTPLVILSDPTGAAWNDYQIEKTNGIYLIHSLNENAQVKSLSLKLNANHEMQWLKMQDIGGQISDYQFSKMKMNQQIASAQFDFKTPEGVEVDDQRIKPTVIPSTEKSAQIEKVEKTDDQ